MTVLQLISSLTQTVGEKCIIADPAKTEQYRQGYRFGEGRTLAVVRPGAILEMWKILQVRIEVDVTVITRAVNTGLTGGSTSDGNDYGRDVVIVNIMRMSTIQTINNNEQVVCLPGSILNQLELLPKPLRREPHSVIGSSCIDASVLGGVCSNSGGALVQRSLTYTEMALFAQVNEEGKLELVNHLGMDLDGTPEEILTNLQDHHYQKKSITQGAGKGYDYAYYDHVRQVDEPIAARFNADPAHHYEVSGYAGKLMVFIVRLDTFLQGKQVAVFYIGTNNINELTDIRRAALGEFGSLPVSGEYIHCDAFDIISVCDKDMSHVIKKFGTHQLLKLFDFKAKVDRFGKEVSFLPKHFSGKAMQFVSKYLPDHLPKSTHDYRDRYEHHLVLKMGGKGVGETCTFLKEYFACHDGAFLECNTEKTQAVVPHRFAVASATIRYRAVHDDEVEDLVTLDVALRRDDRDWFEKLPSEIDDKIIHKPYYGHFMCRVFHQDYVIKKGNDCMVPKREMLHPLD